MNDKEKAAQDAGIQFAMDVLEQIPKGDRLLLETHMTGVLGVFMGALWGSFGTEYARGFIGAQLRGMEPGNKHETFTKATVQ